MHDSPHAQWLPLTALERPRARPNLPTRHGTDLPLLTRLMTWPMYPLSLTFRINARKSPCSGLWHNIREVWSLIRMPRAFVSDHHMGKCLMLAWKVSEDTIPFPSLCKQEYSIAFARAARIYIHKSSLCLAKQTIESPSQSTSPISWSKGIKGRGTATIDRGYSSGIASTSNKTSQPTRITLSISSSIGSKGRSSRKTSSISS